MSGMSEAQSKEDAGREAGESPFSTIEEAIEEIRARPHGRSSAMTRAARTRATW